MYLVSINHRNQSSTENDNKQQQEFSSTHDDGLHGDFVAATGHAAARRHPGGRLELLPRLHDARIHQLLHRQAAYVRREHAARPRRLFSVRW